MLLTVITLGSSAIPSLFDFNNTHATNPSWTGLARHHVIWQVATFDMIAVMALVITWTAGEDVRWLWVPVLLASFAYGGLWTAAFTRPLYNGVLQNPINGVPQFHYTLFGRTFSVDANIALFTPITLLTLVALWRVGRLNGGI